MKTIAMRALAVILGVVLVALAIRPAYPQVTLTAAQCENYAVWSRDIIWARDMGAQRELVRTWLRERAKVEPSPSWGLLLADLDALWGTKADAVIVATLVLRDCRARAGIYGRST